jgi:antitoxin component YwqK of YwqJK toxin-antitoxin module
MTKHFFVFIFLASCTQSLFAQNDDSLDDIFQTKYDSPLTLDLSAVNDEGEFEKEKPEDKKKKVNPKIYFGIKTKNGFAKTGFGERMVVEMFHMLKPKDFVSPEPYTRDFYWYDFKKKKIVNSTRVNKNNAGVLHGHYVKKLGDQVLEEGYFYKGVKHGRWVKLNRHDILQEKEVYWKGWTKQSRLSYYNFEKTQLKEVIPIHYGDREGEYFAYHTNGNLAVVGQFQFDCKIGVWREYYPNAKVKREVKYPLEAFDKKHVPVITKEWDEDGKLIFDRSKSSPR